MGLLRIVLALSVVVAHTRLPLLGLYLFPGPVAVEIFFMISGFYMGLVLETKYNYPSLYWSFLRQRFLRIFPLYWIVLLLSAVVFAGMLKHVLPLGKPFLASPVSWQIHLHSISLPALLSLISTQIVIFGQDVVMFLGLAGEPLSLRFSPNFRLEPVAASQFMLIPPAWTLSLELMFYTVAPFLCRWRTRNIAFLAVASFAVKLWLMYGSGLSLDPWGYRLLPAEIVFFAAGIVTYRKRQFVCEWVQNKPQRVWIATALLLLAMPLFGRLWIARQDYSIPSFFLYAYVLLLLPALFEATKKMRWDRYIGELSYPLYISHVLTLSLVLGFMGRLPVALRGLGCAVATVGVAMLLSRFVETPFEKWRAALFLRERWLSGQDLS